MKLKLIITVVLLALFSGVKAQKVAVKTNLVSDVIFSPNLGV